MAFIDRVTEREEKSFTTTVRTLNNEITANVMGDMGQLAVRKEPLGSLERRVWKFKGCGSRRLKNPMTLVYTLYCTNHLIV